MKTEEFTLEVYRRSDDMWIRQEMIADTLEELVEYVERNPFDDDDEYYYSYWCIEYDKNGNEINSYPIY